MKICIFALIAAVFTTTLCYCSEFTLQDDSGKIIGKFSFQAKTEADKKVKVGAFGNVFLANQIIDGWFTSKMDKLVAIKIANRDDSSQQQMRNEYEAGLIVREKKIGGLPAIYMTGICKDLPPEITEHVGKGEVHALVMDAIQGLDLSDILTTRKLLPDEIVLLAVEILKILVEMHENGLTHGDLRRENVMLTFNDPAQKEKVITKKTKVTLVDLGNANFDGSDTTIVGGDLYFLSPFILRHYLQRIIYLRPQQPDDYKSYVYFIVDLVQDLDWSLNVDNHDNTKDPKEAHHFLAQVCNQMENFQINTLENAKFPKGVLDLLKIIDQKAESRAIITKKELKQYFANLITFHPALF